MAVCNNKGNKADMDNYRSISLTSHIVNIMERIIINRITQDLGIHTLLCRKVVYIIYIYNSQHGCRPQLQHYFSNYTIGLITPTTKFLQMLYI